MRPVTVDDPPLDDRPHDHATAVRRTEHAAAGGDHTDVLAAAAHDLRSPLAIAQGFVDLLRERWDEVDDHEKRHYLERVADRLGDLGRLLGDILDDSRREPHIASHEPETVDLARSVRDVISVIDEVQPDRHITIRSTEEPLLVTADPRAVERVLHNLVSNALAYSPPGSAIDVEVVASGAEVRVSVQDRGSGISSADQQRLFQRFSRLDDDGDGTGLGLYISRRLIESGGGRIWVNSEPGVGSTFSFSLPRA